MKSLVLGALLFLVAATGTFADTRVALVVGNGDYANSAPLPNPINDATAFGEMLGGLGFDVTMAADLDREEFTAALSAFREKAKDADVAAFYYAGHGFQFEGENYLVPIDARLADELSVRGENMALSDVIGLLKGAHIGLVFLDACRDNPLTEELSKALSDLGRPGVAEGLAPLDNETGLDILVAYAAAPGQVAFDGDDGHSPFARALMQHLPTPGIEISAALKRVTQSVRDETGGKQLPQQLTSMATELFLAGEEQVAGATLEADTALITRFVTAELLGGSFADAAHVRRIYAAKVDYFGQGIVDVETLVGWKGAYAASWPNHRFELVPGSLDVSPVGAGASRAYRITFLGTYRAENGVDFSEGTFSANYDLDLTSGRPVIVREARQITSENNGKL